MTRESLAIEVDVSRSGQRVVTVLERLAGTHGLPKILLVDNGPECTSQALDAWAHRHGGKLAFSRPGTPTDNTFIEACAARFREACLNLHGLASVEEACLTIEAWRVEDNTERPHTAWHHQAPAVDNANGIQIQEVQAASGEPSKWTKVWVRIRGKRTRRTNCLRQRGPFLRHSPPLPSVRAISSFVPHNLCFLWGDYAEIRW
jgi:putative transposase